jgi:predicted nucleic acid-binding protein
MLVERLTGKERVFLDTMSVIYFIEQNTAYAGLLRPVFEWVDSGIIAGISSYVTLLEILVQPLSQGRTDLAAQYRLTLTRSPNFFLFPFEETIAERAAQIRADYNFRVPDAIQLATAELRGAECFVTNDKRLERFRNVEVLVLDDFI